MAGWGDGVNTEVAGERVPDKGRAGTLERGGQMMCLRRARRPVWLEQVIQGESGSEGREVAQEPQSGLGISFGVHCGKSEESCISAVQ